MLDVFKKIGYSFRSAFTRGRRPAGENTVNIPEPVYVRELFDGKATVIVFGAPFNWNYAGASREEMEAKNPGIVAALQEVMRKYGVRRALVPKPAFNAKVITDLDLPNELLPNFFRGADADGVILEKSGDAYFLASADCLATILDDPYSSRVAALHCGRDATIDRKMINEGAHVMRMHGSVIDAAMETLHKLALSQVKMEQRSFQAFLAAGIRAETFVHSTTDAKYGAANKRMIDHLIAFDHETRFTAIPGPNAHPPGSGIYHSSPIVTDEVMGNIDLFRLVRRQLRLHGVTRVNEDEFDTAMSKDPEGNFLFHSNRRDQTLRNLVVVLLN